MKYSLPASLRMILKKTQIIGERVRGTELEKWVG